MASKNVLIKSLRFTINRMLALMRRDTCAKKSTFPFSMLSQSNKAFLKENRFDRLHIVILIE